MSRLLRAVKISLTGVGVVIALPIVLVLRLLRPIKLVRFGYFTADRIGHFAFDIEYYLTEKDAAIKQKNSLDLFFFEGVPANKQLEKMCRRQIYVSQLFRTFYLANKIVWGGLKHTINPARVTNDSRDKSGLMSRSITQLKFEHQENICGWNYLERIGVKDPEKYICLVVRDSSYLSDSFRGKDWSYHNHRDSEIETYHEAILALAEKGYTIIRMGKVVQKPLSLDHPNIIDYATSQDRCDFLDIWLMANSYFAISTGLGLDSVADIFKRSIVFVNYTPLMDIESWGRYITVPKKLVWLEDGRPLTLLEQIQHTTSNAHYYPKHGIKISDLLPEEIKDAVLEMEARLTGTWSPADEEELNTRFWKRLKEHHKFKEYHGWVHPDARLGAECLRNLKESI